MGKRIEFEIKVERGVPIPSRTAGIGLPKSPFRLALESMEIGESVLAPRRVVFGGMIPTVQRATNRKFTTRKVDHLTARVWRIA